MMKLSFDEAYKAMRDGAAIARPHWKKINYLFWGRDTVLIAYKSGRIGPLWMFNWSLANATDWFIVEVESLPVLPSLAPKRTPAKSEPSTGERLAARQAQMKARYKRA